MDNISSPLEAKLLQIRDFSDLTLACDGQEFKVHKAYVCAQSPVIAAALKGSFMEAKTGVLNVSFDAQSVQRFIEFIYTGDYHMSPNPALELLSSGVLDKTRTTEKQHKDVEIDEEGVAAAEQGPEVGRFDPSEDISDRLVCHGRMSCMADYYNVSTLATLSLSKAEEVLALEWSTESFCDLVQQSLSSTVDEGFLRMLGAVATEHIHELLRTQIFDKGGLAEGLAFYMLPEVIQRLKATEARETELASSLSSAKAEIASNLSSSEAVIEWERQQSARLSENVDECIKLLKNNHRCRNAGCEAEFCCYLDHKAPAKHPGYILRCARCRTRHE
ncbi:hypothetical protein F4803DRAFT_577438 [Xylaria telfairii]|nr:hypothetical protein F4803DRAFT_577438 [Xylaria telfairii]